jgi:hypothetical protein
MAAPAAVEVSTEMLGWENSRLEEGFFFSFFWLAKTCLILFGWLAMGFFGF